MVLNSESSTIREQIKWRRPKNPTLSTKADQNPNPNIPSIIQSTRCKSTISSLLLSTLTNNHNPENTQNNKKSFKNSTLRGFGCTAPPQVTVPTAHREEKGEKKKKKKKVKKKGQQQQLVGALRDDSNGFGSIGVQDLWCGPGIAGFGADDAADCVVSARPIQGRGKIYVNKVHHREMQVLMFQNGLLMQRSGRLDRYRDWRLDIDSMTYEELLELGERIGYVSTGLGEDQIGQCIRKAKLSVPDELSSESQIPIEVEGNCSICQEEYEAEDELGKLECGHAYHLHCIKQWLFQKNACPVCKTEASSQ